MAEQFESWAILELMGHRRLAGYVTEQEIGGTNMLRIEIPGPDGDSTTQFYSSQAVYAITPTTEDIARRFSRRSQPGPVNVWELLPPPDETESGDDDDDPDAQLF